MYLISSELHISFTESMTLVEVIGSNYFKSSIIQLIGT